MREIQRRALTSPGTASRELARLVAAGLVERQAEGNQVYFRPASSPFAMLVRTMFVVPATPEPDPVTMSVTIPAAPVDAAPVDAASVAVAPVAEAPVAEAPVVAAPEPIRPPRTIYAAASTQMRPRRPDALGLKVAGRLSEVLRPLYSDRLVGLFLYGARVHGEAKQDADVEVVVVLDRVDRYGDELERTSSTCAALSLEFGLIVSRVFISENTWKSRTDGNLLAIRSEAVAV